jgi:two-component system, chemotaxis family, protein-glutamate methylesterase/glutaminase
MTFIQKIPVQKTASLRDPVRVMLVDDSVVARSILSRILSRSDQIHVVVEAPDTKSALSALDQHRVDIILLDIEMPERTGLDALPDMIAKSQGAGIIIVSSFAEENGPSAVKALSLGACDTLAKPGRSGFSGNFSQVLTEKVINLGRSKTPPGKEVFVTSDAAVQPEFRKPACIAIGASTGGIPAIFEIVKQLDRAMDCPIFVTQHLPEAFMTFFARQLAAQTHRTVVVAEEHMLVKPNHIYIAPGNSHLVCRKIKAQIQIGRQETYSKSRYCPSVDAMLESMAAVYGNLALTIILSGMGQDGLIGSRALWLKNARIIAQDIGSSVVWGMPGAVVRENLAEAILSPSDIAATLNRLTAA